MDHFSPYCKLLTRVSHITWRGVVVHSVARATPDDEVVESIPLWSLASYWLAPCHWPTETEVMVSPLLSRGAGGGGWGAALKIVGDVSLGTPARYSLVVDEDVKKRTKQTNITWKKKQKRLPPKRPQGESTMFVHTCTRMWNWYYSPSCRCRETNRAPREFPCPGIQTIMFWPTRWSRGTSGLLALGLYTRTCLWWNWLFCRDISHVFSLWWFWMKILTTVLYTNGGWLRKPVWPNFFNQSLFFFFVHKARMSVDLFLKIRQPLVLYHEVIYVPVGTQAQLKAAASMIEIFLKKVE